MSIMVVSFECISCVAGFIRRPIAQTELSNSGSWRHSGQVQEHQADQPEWWSHRWSFLWWYRRSGQTLVFFLLLYMYSILQNVHFHWRRFLFLSMSTDLCVEDSVHDSPREDPLQNVSTDDLPDSASQTAQQHDCKFSFRSENYQTQFNNPPLNRF